MIDLFRHLLRMGLRIVMECDKKLVYKPVYEWLKKIVVVAGLILCTEIAVGQESDGEEFIIELECDGIRQALVVIGEIDIGRMVGDFRCGNGEVAAEFAENGAEFSGDLIDHFADGVMQQRIGDFIGMIHGHTCGDFHCRAAIDGQQDEPLEVAPYSYHAIQVGNRQAVGIGVGVPLEDDFSGQHGYDAHDGMFERMLNGYGRVLLHLYRMS